MCRNPCFSGSSNHTFGFPCLIEYKTWVAILVLVEVLITQFVKVIMILKNNGRNPCFSGSSNHTGNGGIEDIGNAVAILVLVEVLITHYLI